MNNYLIILDMGTWQEYYYNNIRIAHFYYAKYAKELTDFDIILEYKDGEGEHATIEKFKIIEL
jgi:hypothetical protein